MFTFAIAMLYLMIIPASFALIKGIDIVLRYFGHDTIGVLCDYFHVGYDRRVRMKDGTVVMVRGR